MPNSGCHHAVPAAIMQPLPPSCGTCCHHATPAAVIGGRATLKMLHRRKSKTQFAKQERKMQLRF
jgi:hypothetical protein